MGAIFPYMRYALFIVVEIYVLKAALYEISCKKG